MRPGDDFTPNWEQPDLLRRSASQKDGRLDRASQSASGRDPKRGREHDSPTGNTYFWSAKRAGPEISAESLADARSARACETRWPSTAPMTSPRMGTGPEAEQAAADDDEVDLLDLFDENRGATVTLDGHAYTIKEIKPFRHVPGLDSVMLEPKDKNAAWYRAERAKLHDDWDLEVSDPERLVELAQQLPGWSRPEGVSKHGSGDQSPHGNWARSKELGMVTIPEDDDSPARPEDEERDEELRRSPPHAHHPRRRHHRGPAQGPAHQEQRDVRLGRRPGATELRRVEVARHRDARGAKPPKLHERGRWGVWPRGADRSDVEQRDLGRGQPDPGRVHQLPRPRRI